MVEGSVSKTLVTFQMGFLRVKTLEEAFPNVEIQFIEDLEVSLSDGRGRVEEIECLLSS